MLPLNPSPPSATVAWVVEGISFQIQECRRPIVSNKTSLEQSILAGDSKTAEMLAQEWLASERTTREFAIRCFFRQ